MGFEQEARSQIATALGAQVAPAADAILTELEALRVAFDVRYQSVTEAVAGLRQSSPAWLHEVIHTLAAAASDEAKAAARIARGEAVEQAETSLKFERAQAQERLELVQAEAAAQVDVLRIYTQKQLEAAKAEHRQLLEGSRAQTTAAREEAERTETVHRQLVGELRAQLEHVRAELEQARADLGRAAQVVPALREVPRTGHGARVALGVVRAPLDRPAELAWEEVPLPQDSQKQPAAAGDAESEAERDRLSPAFRAIDQATTLTQVLDALLDGVGAICPRAALFLVKSDRLQGWRSVGFAAEAAVTPQFEVPLAADSVLTQAATTGRTIETGRGIASEAGPDGANREPWSVTLSVTPGDRVAAVVYADEGARAGKEPPLDRDVAFDVSQRLARHAGQRLAELTTPARMAVVGTPSAEATTAQELTDAFAGRRARPQEPHSTEGARRYAHLLVSEIKRYRDADALAGTPDSNLSERLSVEIERCRRMYAGRVSPEAMSTSNFFDEAVFEILGGSDRPVFAEESRRVGT